jgi:hypothetical protein
MLLLRNPKKGVQGSIWAAEPYDDDNPKSHILAEKLVTNNSVLFAAALSTSY